MTATAIAAENSTIGLNKLVNLVALITALKLRSFSSSKRLRSKSSRAKDFTTRTALITSCKSAVISATRPWTSCPATRSFLPKTLIITKTTGTVIKVTNVNFQSMRSIDTKEPISVTDSVIKEIKLSTTAVCNAATSFVRLLMITPVLRRSK